jgi:hypothetical protein
MSNDPAEGAAPPRKSGEFYLAEADRLTRLAETTTRPSARERLLSLAAVYRDLAAYRRDLLSGAAERP